MHINIAHYHLKASYQLSSFQILLSRHSIILLTLQELYYSTIATIIKGPCHVCKDNQCVQFFFLSMC